LIVLDNVAFRTASIALSFAKALVAAFAWVGVAKTGTAVLVVVSGVGDGSDGNGGNDGRNDGTDGTEHDMALGSWLLALGS
jgi:hypothetical protein